MTKSTTETRERHRHQSELCSRGNGVKDGWHQDGLLHLDQNLALNREGGFGDGWVPVAQDHLFVEQEYGVGFLESNSESSELRTPRSKHPT